LADGKTVMHRAPDTRRQRNRRRVIFVVVATLASIASLVWRPPEPAAATATDEDAFVAALNEVRADNGLPAFTVNVELSDLSRVHAQVMADAGEIFHASPISAGYSGDWSKLGENVGVGASVEVLVDAFVASPGHFANIIDPNFTEVGVGVVWRDSALYTTHRFLQLPSAPSTTTMPPTTTTTTTPPAPSTTLDVAPIAPLPEPAISAERVIALLEMLDQVGT